ncbi:MAG: 50S ribosomal protein L17 [Rickettsiales bacterium]|nr:50S ribosomal protein L17 [Rickettsiales bacterium]|tara:strand:- start:103 stop:663 length:561 start_codon:yes stop_codon:yes gene_type:complete
MRHRISGRKLNRKTSHRMALLKNLAKSLIVNEQIETTLPKAKDLRPFVEKILHSGKNNNLHSRRKVFSYLRDNILVNKVFGILAKRYANRNGGYTRVLRSGFRYGDAAPKAIIELVDRDVSAKGYIDKKRVEEQKKQDEQKVTEGQVLNDATQIKTKEKNQKQIDDKVKETKQSSNPKKKEKDSKD